MADFAGSKRISTGKEMTHIAIAVNKRLHPGLFKGKALIKGSAGRSHFFRDLKSDKKCPPFGRDLGRIFLPQLILGIEPKRAHIIDKMHHELHQQQSVGYRIMGSIAERRKDANYR